MTLLMGCGQQSPNVFGACFVRWQLLAEGKRADLICAEKRHLETDTFICHRGVAT